MKLEIKMDSGNELREYAVTKRTSLQGARFKNGGSQFVHTSDLALSFEQEFVQESPESGKQVRKTERHVKYERTQLRKDGKRNFSNPVEHYFLKVEDPMCHLDLRLSSDGRVEELLNHEEVIKKWGYTRIYLDNYFVSDDVKVLETIHGWTNGVEAKVKDLSIFMKELNNDLLINRLFYGYYLDYGDSGCYIHNKELPFFFGTAKLVLQEELNLRESADGYELSVKGLFNEEKSDFKSICGYCGIEEDQLGSLDFSLSGKYDFDHIGLLKGMDLMFKAEHKDSEFKKEVQLTVERK